MASYAVPVFHGIYEIHRLGVVLGGGMAAVSAYVTAASTTAKVPRGEKHNERVVSQTSDLQEVGI
jgi:hypothetical protein